MNDDVEVLDEPEDAEPEDGDDDEPTLADECTAQYRAETDRFRVLDSFVRPFGLYAPRGETDFGAGPSLIDPLRGEYQDDDVVSARNLALIAAFRAIRSIAEGS